MARGGKRTGQIGQAYSNRQDLNTVTKSGVAGLQDLQYGQKQSLMQAASATPTGTQQTVGGAGGGGQPETQQPSGPLPGSFGFGGPTARPNEPVSAGAALGPGPGEEALPGALPGSPSSADQAMTERALPTLEIMSTLPGATMGFKNYVRSLISQAPPR